MGGEGTGVSQGGLRDVVWDLKASEVGQRLQLGLLGGGCVDCAVRALALESLVSVLSLRAQGGPAPETAADDPPAKRRGSLERGLRRGILGKGTQAIRLTLEGCLAAEEDSQPTDIAMLPWPLPLEQGAHNGVSTGGDVLAELFSLLGSGLIGLSWRVRSMIEENQVRRKPKILKGTNDFLPDQIIIREIAFEKIMPVFKHHGAVSNDTPVLELWKTLTGKHGEDSKLMYDFTGQGGEVLSLQYGVPVPFAGFVALHAVGNIKRYHVGQVCW